jgi:hypothetical protein
VGEYEHKLTEMEARLKALEHEKFLLEIDKRAKDQVIGMMREQMTQELHTFTTEISKQSRRVGQLETEMRQLMPPDRDRRPTPDDSTILDDGAAIDAEYRDMHGPAAPHHDDVSTNPPQP